jgi:2-methylcitrate dehydratase
VLAVEKRDYAGFKTRPMSWQLVCAKFERLAALHAPEPLRKQIVETVERLEGVPVSELTALLAGVEGE